MKKKHTILIEKPSRCGIITILHRSKTRRELFAIAGEIGASKKADKWQTACNIGRKLEELQATGAITYIK